MSSRSRKPLEEIFPRGKAVVGVVHLLPLPGSPEWSGEMGSVVLRAVREAAVLEEGGVDGILVENFLRWTQPRPARHQ